MTGGFDNNGDDELKRCFDAALAPLERSVGKAKRVIDKRPK